MIDNEEATEQERKDITKRCNALFNSLDEKAKKIVQELFPLHALLDDSLIYDIKRGLNELAKKDCNKVFITFEGETAAGKTIESKEVIIIHLNY